MLWLHALVCQEYKNLQAVIDEYISLKSSMQRMRAAHVRRTGREMTSRDSSSIYKAAAKRRDELLRAFPGRPWATHADYLRLEAGDKSVGLAPVPVVRGAPSAATSMGCSS